MTDMTATGRRPGRIRPSFRRCTAAAAGLAVALALLAGCSSGNGKDHDDAAPVRTTSPAVVTPDSTTSASSPGPTGTTSVFPTTESAPGAAVPQVRDAFAVLQATYNDSCTTPGNCAYFLNRLLTNLDDLDRSMAASPKDSGHFAQPRAWIRQMQHALGSDVSDANLKRHQAQLVRTRDEINTWMQSHPSDYR